MKNLYKYLIILTGSLTVACENFKPEPGNCVGLVIDLSDTFQEVQELSVEKLKPLFKISQNENASASCILSFITDLRYNETRIIKVPGEANHTANSLERGSKRNTFFSEISKEIQNAKQQPIGTEGSFVLHTIAQTLWKAKEMSKASMRVLVLSDLAEHSSWSIYRKADFELLKTNPDSVFATFDRLYPLPDIRGVEIHLIHVPHNKAEDAEFHLIGNALKRYYEKHAARVTISTSIPNE